MSSLPDELDESEDDELLRLEESELLSLEDEASLDDAEELLSEDWLDSMELSLETSELDGSEEDSDRLALLEEPHAAKVIAKTRLARMPANFHVLVILVHPFFPDNQARWQYRLATMKRIGSRLAE
jgi:hypothetical protein